jgi:hypothetical protein
MDPLQSTQRSSGPTPSLYRSSLTGISVEQPIHVTSDRVSFDGDGRIKALDLSQGTEIAINSANGKDSIELRATYYELALGPGGPISLSLPGFEGKLTTEIADTQVSVRGGVSLASLTAPGVFRQREADGSTRYRLEAGPLGMDFRDPESLLLLDGAAVATESIYDAASATAGAFVDAFETIGQGLGAAWRWASGTPQPTREEFRLSRTTPGDRGDVAREAMFIAPFAKAAYEGGATPPGAARENIAGLFDPSDGFSADLFRTRQNGRETFVLAFRGTDNLPDVEADVGHAAYVPSQYVQAVNLAAALRAKHPDADIILTGHSLGGGLASFAGLMTGTRAYAFNSAGPQVPTLLALPDGAQFDLVTHINTESDPLTGLAGDVAGRSWGSTVCTIREESLPADPNAPEFRQSLRDRTVSVAQWIEHHSMNSVAAKLAESSVELDCVREAAL